MTYLQRLQQLRNYRNAMRFIGERIAPAIAAFELYPFLESLIYCLRVMFAKGGG